MIKQSFLPVLLCVLCANNLLASDVQQQSATNSEPKHVYDLPKLAQQLKRLPTVLALYILHLSEASKSYEVFSSNDEVYKNFMVSEHVIGPPTYVANREKALLSMKGKEATDANMLDLFRRINTCACCLGPCTAKPVLAHSIRSEFSSLVESKVRVSTLNQKVMRSLVPVVSQKRKREDKESASYSKPS